MIIWFLNASILSMTDVDDRRRFQTFVVFYLACPVLQVNRLYFWRTRYRLGLSCLVLGGFICPMMTFMTQGNETITRLLDTPFCNQWPSSLFLSPS